MYKVTDTVSHAMDFFGYDSRRADSRLHVVYGFYILPPYFTYVIANGLTNEVDPKHIARFMSIFYRYTDIINTYSVYMQIYWYYMCFILRRLIFCCETRQPIRFVFPPHSFITQVDDHPLLRRSNIGIFQQIHTVLSSFDGVFACKKQVPTNMGQTPPQPYCTGPGAKLYTSH